MINGDFFTTFGQKYLKSSVLGNAGMLFFIAKTATAYD